MIEIDRGGSNLARYMSSRHSNLDLEANINLGNGELIIWFPINFIDEAQQYNFDGHEKTETLRSELGAIGIEPQIDLVTSTSDELPTITESTLIQKDEVKIKPFNYDGLVVVEGVYSDEKHKDHNKYILLELCGVVTEQNFADQILTRLKT